MKDLAEMIDVTLPKPGSRGPYKRAEAAENSNCATKKSVASL